MEDSMGKLARPITHDEVASYKFNGVVLLRGILDLAAVNALRRCIDEAVQTIGESPSGYDLSMLTKAAELEDRKTLEEHSDGQHNVSGIIDYIKASGKPFLFDQTQSANGSFLLDTGLAAPFSAFPRVTRGGSGPRINPSAR